MLAHEARERLDHDTAAENTEIINSLQSAFDAMLETLVNVTKNLNDTEDIMDEEVRDLEPRLDWDEIVMKGGIRYIIHYDFIRGYQVFAKYSKIKRVFRRTVVWYLNYGLDLQRTSV